MNTYIVKWEYRYGVRIESDTYQVNAKTKKEALDIAAREFFSTHKGFFATDKRYRENNNTLELLRVIGPRGSFCAITFTIVE